MDGGEEVLLEGRFLIGLGRREVEGKVRVKMCETFSDCYKAAILKVILTPSHIAISLAATNCFARFLCHQPPARIMECAHKDD